MAADHLDPLADHDCAAQAFAVVDPLTDLTGDGIADTVLLDRPGGGVAILTDLDGNGYADHVTTIEHDGRCVAWQLTSGIDGGWHVTAEDHL